MTLSLYLGRGSVSRGRTTIGKGLNMVVSTIPWGNENDLAAVAIALDHMADALTTVPGLTYLYGPKASTNYSQSAPNLTGAEFLATVRHLQPICALASNKHFRFPLPMQISVPAGQITGSALPKWELTAASLMEQPLSTQTPGSMVRTIFSW